METTVDFKGSLAFEEVIQHRKNCPKWGKEFCLECFGGGLKVFTEKLLAENKIDIV